MYHNGYSVRVVGGDEIPGGYVAMEHGKTYFLNLRNSHGTRCDAYVEIDGKNVGTFRIGPHGAIPIHRPAHDTGQFTFYKLGTPEAEQAGVQDNVNLGLIKVTFTPEARSSGYVSNVAMAAPDWSWTNTTLETSSARTLSVTNYTGQSLIAGGTGLSGESGQRFREVSALDNYDYSQQVTIHLRLVSRDNGPRPLTSYSTPVPPRV